MPFFKSKPRNPRLQVGHPLTRGLVFDMPFFERGGDVVHELTGFAPAFTYENIASADWVDNPFGGGMSFDGGERIYFNPRNMANDIFDMRERFSSQVIFYRDAANQFDFYYCYTVLYGGAGRKFALYQNNTQLNFHLNFDIAGSKDCQSTITNNTWINTIHTYDGTDMFSFHDGIQKGVTNVGEDTIISGATNSMDQFNIGQDRSDWDDGDLDGDMALVRIWNRTLYPNEISLLTADPWIIYRKPWYRSFGKVISLARRIFVIS